MGACTQAAMGRAWTGQEPEQGAWRTEASGWAWSEKKWRTGRMQDTGVAGCGEGLITYVPH